MEVSEETMEARRQAFNGIGDGRPTREELAHEVERLRGLMEQQDRRIIRLTAELNMHAKPKGFVNAKKRRRMEARAVKHAIVEVMR
jgi:hypothetical protein